MRTRSQRNRGACAPRRSGPAASAASAGAADGRGPVRAPARAPGPGPSCSVPSSLTPHAPSARRTSPGAALTSSSASRRAGGRARRVGARDRRRVAEGLDQERVQGLGLATLTALLEPPQRRNVQQSDRHERRVAHGPPLRRRYCFQRARRRRAWRSAPAPRPGRAAGRPQRSGAPSTASACCMASSARRCSSLSRSESRASPRFARPRASGAACSATDSRPGPAGRRGTRNNVPQRGTSRSGGAAGQARHRLGAREHLPEVLAAVAVWALAVGRFGRPARSQGAGAAATQALCGLCRAAALRLFCCPPSRVGGVHYVAVIFCCRQPAWDPRGARPRRGARLWSELSF